MHSLRGIATSDSGRIVAVETLKQAHLEQSDWILQAQLQSRAGLLSRHHCVRATRLGHLSACIGLWHEIRAGQVKSPSGYVLNPALMPLGRPLHPAGDAVFPFFRQ
jgi:hypothetical protein